MQITSVIRKKMLALLSSLLRRRLVWLIVAAICSLILLMLNVKYQEQETSQEASLRPWFMRGGKLRSTYTTQLRLFPEDAPEEDRIIDQLMFTLPPNIKPQMKTILLPDGYVFWTGTEPGQAMFIKDKCPVDRCSLTTEWVHAATADAIMFNDFSFRDTASPFKVKRPLYQIWIRHQLESPSHTPPLHWLLLGAFNWTSSYRRDSDVVAPYARWEYYDHGVMERKQDINYAANKTKKVAWLISNCVAKNSVRYKYAQELSEHIAVDFLGKCTGKRVQCPEFDPSCFNILRDYKFYLAFENSNCWYYITEKFFQFGLSNNLLPIVMGARPSDYAAVAPRHSFIHIEEFAGPKDLASYLHQLDKDDDLYNSYFKWKGTGEFINTYYFCRVCAMLHANAMRNRSVHYTDVQTWWKRDTCTSGQWGTHGN